MLRGGALVALLVVLLLASIPLACGGRTGLLAGDEPSAADAGADVRPDVREAGLDAPPEGAPSPPPPDVCPDAGATLVYVITEDPPQLYSFYPPTAQFHAIGTLDCPTTDQVFSMAVDRSGIAYVLFQTDGQVFRVDTATAKCTAIPYTPGQQGFTFFGMGYASDPVDAGGDGGETLYLMGSPDFSSSPGLASLDTSTFTVSFIGTNEPPLDGAELTGTGAGALYSFYFYASDTSTAYLGQIDRQTGAVTGQTPLPGVDPAGGFAVAYWGGDFYLFTAPGGSTQVTRYRPADGSIAAVATLPGAIVVGAGVSTCAPQ